MGATRDYESDVVGCATNDANDLVDRGQSPRSTFPPQIDVVDDDDGTLVETGKQLLRRAAFADGGEVPKSLGSARVVNWSERRDTD